MGINEKQRPTNQAGWPFQKSKDIEKRLPPTHTHTPQFQGQLSFKIRKY